VVKEEIVIRKHAVQETKDVEADLRRERVSVDRTSGVREVSDRMELTDR
jgi:stress response protein YsnF